MLINMSTIRAKVEFQYWLAVSASMNTSKIRELYQAFSSGRRHNRIEFYCGAKTTIKFEVKIDILLFARA